METELLRKLFKSMQRIRLIEEGIADHYAEEEMRCPVHLCIGQEAIAVGVCAYLRPGDLVMSGHRSHGHYLAKGGDLKGMLAEIYGKETGCCGGKGGSMHMIDLPAGFLGATPIVASTIPIAVGAAFGSVMRGENRVVAIFFGEAATEEGAFHEAINFAVLKKLPVLFVCENNFFSVYSPLSVRQPEGREIFRFAAGYGLESHCGDGNDLLEVAELSRQALQRMRAGHGPEFLEFKTYRWREHCGPMYDNQLGYRTEEEFLAWKKRCPLEQMRRRLLERGLMSEAEIEADAREIRAEIKEAVRFAKESPFPKPETMLDHVCKENV